MVLQNKRLDPYARVAVITGGASGIGEHMVRHFVAAGWRVAFCDLNDTPRTRRLVDELNNGSIRVLFQPCDVSSPRDVDKFFCAVDNFGDGPHLLVNNAGVQTWSPLLELDVGDWDRVINTNLRGCFLNTKRAAKSMIRRGIKGAIVNIGSGCNRHAFPKLVDYAASKGGIDMLTKASAIELGEYNIRVNCVAPGGILIDRTREEAPDYEATWANITPLARVGKPEDITNAVNFLASEEASFITGQTIFVDGGVFTKANWPYAS